MNYEMVFLGWFCDEKSDKIWGVVSLPDDKLTLTFWGRRESTSYSWKEMSEEDDILKLINSKLKKGYEHVIADEENDELAEAFDETWIENFEAQLGQIRC